MVRYYLRIWYILLTTFGTFLLLSHNKYRPMIRTLEEHMGKTKRYLKESATGFWSYRRVVPKHLRDIMDFREWKKAFNTKFKAQAFKDFAEYHQEVENEIKIAEERLTKAKKAFSSSSKFDEKLYIEPNRKWMNIYNRLLSQKRLPHQAPKLDITATEDEQSRWVSDMRLYSDEILKHDKVEGYWTDLDQLYSSLKHPQFKEYVKHREYIRYIEQEYDLLNLDEQSDENNEIVITRNILSGNYTPPDPTLETLLEFYLELKRQESRHKERSVKQQRHLEKNCTRYMQLAASAHPEGMLTPLSQLDKEEIAKKFEQSYERTDTRKRNLTDLRAAVNAWNKSKPQYVIGNVFHDLIELLPEVDSQRRERLVWTPDQWRYFWQSIKSEENPEVKIVGMLLAYAGKPQGESAGLTRNDVKLKAPVPHITYESNEIRPIGKKRQDMVLPLVGEMLAALQTYCVGFKGSRYDPLFPSLHKLYSGDLSNRISKHHPKGVITRENEIFDSYGLRHTFKPRYEAAGVEEKLGMYLFGHKTKETSQIHENYAKGAKHEKEWFELQKRMCEINATKDWATHKKYSDFDPE